MITKYKIDVVGLLWSGAIGSLSKGYDFVPAENKLSWIKSDFGDFDMINDYRITQITSETKTEGRKFITTITEEVINEFMFPEESCAAMETF